MGRRRLRGRRLSPHDDGGSLTVVGTGIQAGTHLTAQARSQLEKAQTVLFLVAEPIAAAWLQQLRPDARSLNHLYVPGRPRREIYDALVEELVAPARAGERVCAAFYGHPGVFVDPSHRAVGVLREEGIPARMLPAVSAEDCLYADLGVDPGTSGCQSYEATSFLLHGRRSDPTAALLLWQVSVIGETGVATESRTDRLAVLADYLARIYPADHEVVLYEASPYVFADPVVLKVPLSGLADAQVSPLATLYVPPAEAPELDPAMAERLGLSPR